MTDTREKRLKEALDDLYRDNHSWSKRPCPTCGRITEIVGFAFGCDKMAGRKALAAPADVPRCKRCDWPIVPEGEAGCWESNCSMRPMPSAPEALSEPPGLQPEMPADALEAAYQSDVVPLVEAANLALKWIDGGCKGAFPTCLLGAALEKFGKG